MDTAAMAKMVNEVGVKEFKEETGVIVLKNGRRLVPEAYVSAGCESCGYGSKTSITWSVK